MNLEFYEYHTKNLLFRRSYFFLKILFLSLKNTKNFIEKMGTTKPSPNYFDFELFENDFNEIDILETISRKFMSLNNDNSILSFNLESLNNDFISKIKILEILKEKV
jgi:hypothetical protein